MARWQRAARLLDLAPGSRLLDLGCAFGFGTRLLTGRYRTFGHDLSAPSIARARRFVPAATFSIGPADSVPYPEGAFDGVLLLDVLEHVPDEAAVIREVARVLRPGGQLVLSVPNAGLLASWDSLNIAAQRLDSNTPPTDDPSWPASPQHRHYALHELRCLLQPDFQIRSAHYTGIGLAEAVNLVLLLALRRRWPAVYARAQYLYFTAYLLEDLLPTGSWGYHLMVDAERLDNSGQNDYGQQDVRRRAGRGSVPAGGGDRDAGVPRSNGVPDPELVDYGERTS